MANPCSSLVDGGAHNGPLFACIEAGGTKVVAGVARDVDDVIATARFPTTSPVETIEATLAFFHDAARRHGAFDAAGIASFGPVDLDRSSAGWGRILSTPKPGWAGFDLAGSVGKGLACPVEIDTDVNGALLAESRWGIAAGADVAVYVTVGTGIGGGMLVDGRLVHGQRHPEMGHMLPRRHPLDNFVGICPFHGDCLEGLASGPAIQARWGASLSELADEHPSQAIVADYLAQLVIAQQALLSPRCVILGGGVMATPRLLDRVRARVTALGGGYFGGEASTIVVPPALGDRAGLLGALALAQRARQ